MTRIKHPSRPAFPAERRLYREIVSSSTPRSRRSRFLVGVSYHHDAFLVSNRHIDPSISIEILGRNLAADS